ncbi:MAG: ABC transporter ATP-binding protein [Oligoflexia bacterium]|nr:ABC transporter ATP-binding protein [Oligoflexia bacterium]
MAELLEISHVEQVFRSGFWMARTQVLHDVSLSVPERSIFGFLGANGAGKTSLIHLIVGIRRPTAGTIKLRGEETWRLEQKARIGYLPERPYFHEHLTGESLLRFFGALSGMSRLQIAARIPVVLSAVGMTAARKIELRKYSKGMLQRIGIAQAILHDPEFLVLDEPMSGLDPLGRKEMRELILSLASEGRTIFFSSHVIPDVEAICDRVALIQKGRLVGCGSIGSFLAQGPRQTEIAFSGLDVATAEASGRFTSVRSIPDGVRATVSSQEAVTLALSDLLSRGAQVLWVSPIRPSLESFFEEPAK